MSTGTFRGPPYRLRIRCPRCRSRLLPSGYPGALSRADNVTEVCSECGVEEALRDLGGLARENPALDWPVRR